MYMFHNNQNAQEILIEAKQTTPKSQLTDKNCYRTIRKKLRIVTNPTQTRRTLDLADASEAPGELRRRLNSSYLGLDALLEQVEARCDPEHKLQRWANRHEAWGAVQRPLFHEMHVISDEDNPEGSTNSLEEGTVELRTEEPAA